QELPLRFLGPKETGEDRTVPAKCLLPPIGSLADRVFQVAPQFPENRVRVIDVTGQTRRALLAQIRSCRGRVLVLPTFALEQLQTRARVEQALERIGVERQFFSQVRKRFRAVFERVEYAQRYRGKHRLRATKRFQKIENDGGIGLRAVTLHAVPFFLLPGYFS